MEPIVFSLGKFLRHLVRDAARIVEDVALVEGEEGVELAGPVAHVHGNAAHRLAFGEKQVLLDQIVQGGQLVLLQVVLGDGDVLLADLTAPPTGQSHVW